MEARAEDPVAAPDDADTVREEIVPGPTVSEIRVKVGPDDETRHPWWATSAWGLVVAAGLACLVAALVPVGPSWLDGVGAVAVVSAYTWALAARTGGRPIVFGGLALLLGATVLITDESYLRTGAAVMTCVVSAVLAVMVTVPAEHFARVARECGVAVAVAAIGALAVVGFDPVLSLVRFEYVTLALSLVGVLVLVYRLGAGWHGLGRRGLLGVLVGGAILAGLLLYAELLRRYGPPELVTSLLDGVRWSRDNLGAFPRPIEAVLGVPALAWGVHMRARRRQGWWLCAFGAAGTTAVANSVINPAISLRECGLSVVYGLAVGLLIGFAVIRAEIALTGGSGRGRRAGGPTTPVRPEPPRSAALL
ncbi:hypothetical protein [Nocardioides sp.]|uniref:hypothetical protein n=1 Tax=Nocardioides sp. TaxID=35761 RepID=UPI0025EB31F0|nr:hypothetical protein [Nocardioides sp.]